MQDHPVGQPYFHKITGLYLKLSSEFAKFFKPISLYSLDLLHMLAIAHLGAWLRIIQSFPLLLCSRSLPRVFITFSYNKVVGKALRRSPQFRNVALLNSHNKTSWLYNAFHMHICITLFVHNRVQIPIIAANCSGQV